MNTVSVLCLLSKSWMKWNNVSTVISPAYALSKHDFHVLSSTSLISTSPKKHITFLLLSIHFMEFLVIIFYINDFMIRKALSFWGYTLGNWDLKESRYLSKIENEQFYYNTSLTLKVLSSFAVWYMCLCPPRDEKVWLLYMRIIDSFISQLVWDNSV